METALVSETEVRPADRWVEANKRATARKTRKTYVPGGIRENRERLIEAMVAVSERRRARVDRVYCPECQLPFSRGYIPHHRRGAHGTSAPSSIHQGYVSILELSAPKRGVLCPECGAIYSRNYMSKHRARAHDFRSSPGVHHHYVPAP